jgi:hypothetical protein
LQSLADPEGVVSQSPKKRKKEKDEEEMEKWR